MADILKTERLTLEPAARADLDILHAHWTDAEVRAFLFDGETVTLEYTAGAIERSLRESAAEAGLWIVRVHGSDDLAGAVGLRPLDAAGTEIYYSLAASGRGRGYATEAARAVVEHALTVLALPAVLAEVDEGNKASVAVVARLGMTAYATEPGLLGQMIRYRRTR
ncbi:GNAT family N-acetyltransferase [Yinghuangia soli]|uniref:GNAT family N-acetyltransferase n=1 Tax=Yinghuangia soli TaxID=2908204 RepID=A0AA41PXC8_9ACTN|nr:GNAT family N-acetyltransferase [Yinghuangia soli]MCF2527090.1 GNAT family N-acetyltransferase [Yinghuangia soli]